MASSNPDPKYLKALHFSAIAAYKQTGLENKAKEWEKRHLSDEVRSVGGWIAWGIGVANTKMIVYGWEF